MYSFSLPLIYTGHPWDTGSTPGMFPTVRPTATSAFLFMPQMPQILHLLQSSGPLGMALSGTPRGVQQWAGDVCAEVKSGQHSLFSRGGCYQLLKVLYPSSQIITQSSLKEHLNNFCPPPKKALCLDCPMEIFTLQSSFRSRSKPQMFPPAKVKPVQLQV